MDISTKSERGVTVVSICGNLDGSTAGAAQEKIVPMLTAGCRLVIDMARCGYVSSAGLRVLLVIAKQLDRVGGSGAFAALNEQTVDVMTMTGFDNIFKSYGSVAEAIVAVEKGI